MPDPKKFDLFEAQQRMIRHAKKLMEEDLKGTS